MAKEIDKIIQSKTAPKDKNVLWDDGENLKINRNGKWEEANKESASNQELYAYPVDTLDGKENKVIGLGSDAMYYYVGEIVASENGPTEEKVLSNVIHTSYLYQPIYGGKYIDHFAELMNEKYITLYIGNDIDGYTSNKVYISEDANNLTYYYFTFISTFGPRSLKVAISPDYIIYCKDYWHYANKNSKVFFAVYKQQLDVNLIPQEIARKEDIGPETIKNIKNYDTEECNASFRNYVEDGGNVSDGLYIEYGGELGSKTLVINNYVNDIDVSFQYKKEDQNYFYYSSDIADIRINKKTKVLNDMIVHSYDLSIKKIIFRVRYSEFTQSFYFDTSRSYANYANDDSLALGIRIYFEMGNQRYVSIIDSAYYYYNNTEPFYCVYLRHKYIEFKIKTSVEIGDNNKYYCSTLEVTKEIDIPSLESRLAALEAK